MIDAEIQLVLISTACVLYAGAGILYGGMVRRKISLNYHDEFYDTV
jgi:ammonia channel protein AmtB